MILLQFILSSISYSLSLSNWVIQFRLTRKTSCISLFGTSQFSTWDIFRLVWLKIRHLVLLCILNTKLDHFRFLFSQIFGFAVNGKSITRQANQARLQLDMLHVLLSISFACNVPQKTTKKEKKKALPVTWNPNLSRDLLYSMQNCRPIFICPRPRAILFRLSHNKPD